jgi:hypothetical protein
MKNHNRDLLLLYKANVNQEALEKAVECLHKILLRVECNEVFCNSHELVKRTFISRKPKAILKAITMPELKPFYFLINKN